MDPAKWAALLQRMICIREHPPNMHGWKARDAWITAVNACMNETSIAQRKEDAAQK